MVLALFDYVDTICSEQFHKETKRFTTKSRDERSDFSKG